ncbi:putative circularly permuted ATP-grasp superfamily protein [Georgenia soli]|uniref:Putative circularly permuted ATP-grasp superfamily protein n=1 Tax=Georgenia soli TaxID=638953 RepID=A0A2A9EN96_9MICO|nr:circularly permuted type 2 ATP-grasp protein [Georgenia soli]PFG40076.1 putative circularly permuted ATP-grasp superfamily protein [Georgenia soli]
MGDLLEAYRAHGPGHDEMLQATGPTRSAWTELAEYARLGRAERLEAARSDVVTLLQNQGVTYGGDDGWRLDPLPVLVDELEWQRLERGLRQRAGLLDQVLTDLYGERRLLTSGLLPPEIVLAHPGFVRAAHGITVPGPHQLFHTATDLARNADGAWTVLTDRTDVPLGMGYVMADRRVVAEALAGPYRASRTRRVGPFYAALYDALLGAAPSAARDDPRVAVLAPGPAAPTAFDHGYLALLLGVPLVEGGDLAVEDGRVWLRSLGRREPVDVLLRAVPANAADPLDLDPASTQGTVGLVHAARSGAVSVVNTLGSGVLENPALATYLPRLSRALLDEELELPSAVTYWCGDRSMCSHVIANLGRLIVRPVSGAEPPAFGWELSLGERADLAARIAARPAGWVGQEPVEASTTPTLAGGALEPRPTSLRTFTLAHGADYLVMSGALGHVGAGPRATLTGTTLPGTAKDVWVLAPEPLRVAAPALPGHGLLPGRSPDATISPRVADDLFWLGRHTERAEAAVRMLRTVADLWDDYHARPGTSADDPGGQALGVLLAALRETTADAGLAELVTDESLEGSLAWTLARLARDAAGVRDHLTPDVWLALSSMERTLQQERARRRADVGDGGAGQGPVLMRLLEALLTLQGIYAESLVRDVGWRMLEVGRRLERSRHVVATLRATLGVRRDPAVETLVTTAVVTAHESAITFRRRYPAGGVRAVLDLLLADPANPRSLAFQLEHLRRHLADLPAVARGPATRDQLLDDVGDLLTELRTDRAVREDAEGRRTVLERTLGSMAWRLDELGAEITRVHLTRPTPTRWPGGRRPA